MPEFSWMKVFHPRGVQVSVALPFEPPAALLQTVTAYLDAGWLIAAPGLEEGEEKESVGWIMRGAIERDGETTPFVLLYAANEALTWSFLKVYLNTEMDVQGFEHGSGMTLDKLPEYVGNDKPQRGASPKTDRFIVKAPRPFGVVYKKNPKHDDTEAGKMKPARLFVRWEQQRPTKAETAEAKVPLKGEEQGNALLAEPKQLSIDCDELFQQLGWSQERCLEIIRTHYKVHDVTKLTNDQLRHMKKRLEATLAKARQEAESAIPW